MMFRTPLSIMLTWALRSGNEHNARVIANAIIQGGSIDPADIE